MGMEFSHLNLKLKDSASLMCDKQFNVVMINVRYSMSRISFACSLLLI